MDTVNCFIINYFFIKAPLDTKIHERERYYRDRSDNSYVATIIEQLRSRLMKCSPSVTSRYTIWHDAAVGYRENVHKDERLFKKILASMRMCVKKET